MEETPYTIISRPELVIDYRFIDIVEVEEEISELKQFRHDVDEITMVCINETDISPSLRRFADKVVELDMGEQYPGDSR